MQKKTGKFVPSKYKLKVKRAVKGAGLGLYTEEDIPKGKCIIEYVGRVISKEEELNSKSKYLFEVSKNKTIDGTARSNTARYINHSHRPNCEVEIHDKRVFIFSRRGIKAGEELNYDYGTEYVNEHIKPIGCKCAKCMEKGSAVKAKAKQAK